MFTLQRNIDLPIVIGQWHPISSVLEFLNLLHCEISLWKPRQGIVCSSFVYNQPLIGHNVFYHWVFKQRKKYLRFSSSLRCLLLSETHSGKAVQSCKPHPVWHAPISFPSLLFPLARITVWYLRCTFTYFLYCSSSNSRM